MWKKARKIKRLKNGYFLLLRLIFESLLDL